MLLRGTTLVVLLVAGCMYVLSAWYSPELLHAAGIPFRVDSEYLAENGALYMSARIALHAPSFVLVLWVMRKDPQARERLSPFADRSSYLIAAGVVTGLGTVALDQFGLWPAVWRWNPAAYGFAAALVEHKAWVAAGLLLVMFSIVVPFVEEAVFRVAINEALLRSGVSPAGAVFWTSAAFTATHFGPSFRMSHRLAAHGLLLFLFACVLGAVTLRRHGKIASAVWIHGVRNFVEQTTAFIAVVRL